MMFKLAKQTSYGPLRYAYAHMDDGTAWTVKTCGAQVVIGIGEVISQHQIRLTEDQARAIAAELLACADALKGGAQ